MERSASEELTELLGSNPWTDPADAPPRAAMPLAVPPQLYTCTGLSYRRLPSSPAEWITMEVFKVRSRLGRGPRCSQIRYYMRWWRGQTPWKTPEAALRKSAAPTRHKRRKRRYRHGVVDRGDMANEEEWRKLKREFFDIVPDLYEIFWEHLACFASAWCLRRIIILLVRHMPWFRWLIMQRFTRPNYFMLGRRAPVREPLRAYTGESRLHLALALDAYEAVQRQRESGMSFTCDPTLLPPPTPSPTPYWIRHLQTKLSLNDFRWHEPGGVCPLDDPT